MFSLAPYWSTTNWADWNRLRRSHKKAKLLVENLHSAFILWLLNGVIIWFGFRGGLIRRLRFLLSLKSFTDKLHGWTPELWSIFRWNRSFETIRNHLGLFKESRFGQTHLNSFMASEPLLFIAVAQELAGAPASGNPLDTMVLWNHVPHDGHFFRGQISRFRWQTHVDCPKERSPEIQDSHVMSCIVYVQSLSPLESASLGYTISGQPHVLWKPMKFRAATIATTPAFTANLLSKMRKLTGKDSSNWTSPAGRAWRRNSPHGSLHEETSWRHKHLQQIHHRIWDTLSPWYYQCVTILMANHLFMFFRTLKWNDELPPKPGILHARLPPPSGRFPPAPMVLSCVKTSVEVLWVVETTNWFNMVQPPVLSLYKFIWQCVKTLYPWWTSK